MIFHIITSYTFYILCTHYAIVYSIILNELKGKHPKWTQIENEEQYNNIQNEIKTGLKFDFEKWQKDEQ